MSSLGFDSLRVQRRWCGILLKVTWLLTAIAAAIGFHTGIRMGFLVLLFCFPVILVELMLRDHLLRRTEQRRQARRRRETSMSAAE